MSLCSCAASQEDANKRPAMTCILQHWEKTEPVFRDLQARDIEQAAAAKKAAMEAETDAKTTATTAIAARTSRLRAILIERVAFSLFADQGVVCGVLSN